MMEMINEDFDGYLWDDVMFDIFPQAKDEADIAVELDDLWNDQAGYNMLKMLLMICLGMQLSVPTWYYIICGLNYDN